MWDSDHFEELATWEKIFLALALGIQYFVKGNDPLDSLNM